jgi:hypothetical protein
MRAGRRSGTTPKELDYAEIKAMAEEYYTSKYIRATYFFDDAITNIHKNRFVQASFYLHQAAEYLKANGCATPTCVTVFAKKRKQIEKKYMATKKRYTTKGRYNVKSITKHDFTYSCIVPDDSERIDLQKKKSKKK